MARLCPLFSGSKGNSYYIGSKSAGILVDAGRTAKQLDTMLRACEIDPLAIAGILVTHEHTDHVSALRVFAKKYQVPIFASPGTLGALRGSLGEAVTYEMPDCLQLGDMEIHPFHTSHDCAEPLGFRIRTKDERTVTVCTDLGFLSPEVEDNLLGSDFVVLESNHDVGMLRQGPYPWYLQKRILSDCGHLSNDVCAGILPRLLKSGTTRMLLAHLSHENNSRTLALETAMRALVLSGFVANQDFILDAAKPANDTHAVIRF